MKTFKIATIGLLMTMSVLTASAQKWGATPEDSVDCVTNTFLYREAFKNKQYIEAYEPWKQCLEKCPANNKNLYIRGVTILKSKFNATKDPEQRKAIVDELMHMYDLRIQYFGEAAEVTARKAFDLEQLRGNAALKDYYQLYAEAMNLGADGLEVAFIERYFDATIKYVTSGFADTTLIIDNYDIASDAIDKLLATTTDSTKRDELHKVLINIENHFSPFASCDELVKIYTKKFNTNSDDITLLKKITTILRKKKCMDTELFFAATEKLHALEPTPSTAYLMAQMCYNKEKYTDAAKYINDAIQGAEEKDKYNMYILQGLCYANSNNYSAARSSYNRAAEMEPTKGEPYRLISQLYAKGARAISDNLGGRSAYWAAVDAARKAISVDDSPENVEAAQRLINSYSGHFPKQDDAFMLDLIDGNSYTVPGWIGVTTTVRTRK
jgi:tetratricopeptide (TPR) repeat protein